MRMRLDFGAVEPVCIGGKIVVVVWSFISVSVPSLVWSASGSFDNFWLWTFVLNHGLRVFLFNNFNRLV